MRKLKNAIVLCLFHAIYLMSSVAFSMVPELGDKNCDSLLLVSSWTKNNVKIFDGCSGVFIRDLDSQSLIDGPLGLLQAPDGDLLVISENNSRLLKFDRKTLTKGTVIMGDNPNTQTEENNFISKPSAAVIDEKGFMYAASYELNSVVKIDTKDWKIIDQLLLENTSHIKGIDAGIVLNNGHLFLPGYDSDNVIKINLATKVVTEVIAKNTSNLDAPRTIRFHKKEMFISAEKSNAVMVFDANSGQFKRNLVEIVRPTGLQNDGEGFFLVNTQDAVFRVSLYDNEHKKIIQNGSGDLAGGTFVYRLRKIQ